LSDGVTAALVAAVETAAADLDGIDRTDEGGVVELRRAGRAFARLDPSGPAFRLVGELGAAALRTPGATASSFGRGWVAFDPGILDRFALDRATSWLELAWRHAADPD
jgi:hypothetical protein